jgi:hypothetical protein
VNDDTGTVDDRLEAAAFEADDRSAEIGHDLVERGDDLAATEGSEMLPNELDDERARQIEVAKRFEYSPDCGNRATRRFHPGSACASHAVCGASPQSFGRAGAFWRGESPENGVAIRGAAELSVRGARAPRSCRDTVMMCKR